MKILRGWLECLAIFLGKKAAKWLCYGVLGSFLLAAAELGIAYFIQVFLCTLGVLPKSSSLSLATNVTSISVVCTLLLIVALLRSLGQFLVYQSSSFTNEILNERLRISLAARILLSDHRPAANEVHSKLSELFPKSAQFCFYAAQVFAALIQISALSVVMTVVAPKEAILSLTLLSVIGLVILRLNKIVRFIAATLPENHDRMIKSVESIVNNWLLLKVLKTTEAEFRRLVSEFDKYSSSAKKAYTLGNLTAAGTPFGGVIILIVTIWLSQKVFKTPGLDLIAFLYLFVRFVQLLSGAAASLGLASAYFTHFKLGLKYFEEAQNDYRKGCEKLRSMQQNYSSQESKDLTSSACEVRVCDLVFYYKHDTPIVDNLNFVVKAGQQVGIIGRSGSGKSTLLSLIMGVLQPREGDVKIGAESAKTALEGEEIKIGYVGPEPFLFVGTVRDNLIYGLRHHPSDYEMYESLAKVGLDTIGLSLAQEVAPAGINFSTGQRQRLCLARAILQRPDLLVLDEVSANLDSHTERLITESLRELKGLTTMVISTHRDQILKYADEIIQIGCNKTSDI